MKVNFIKIYTILFAFTVALILGEKPKSVTLKEEITIDDAFFHSSSPNDVEENKMEQKNIILNTRIFSNETCKRFI